MEGLSAFLVGFLILKVIFAFSLCSLIARASSALGRSKRGVFTRVTRNELREMLKAKISIHSRSIVSSSSTH